MYIDHSALNYVVNKPVLGGRICRLLLLFQDYYFEVIVTLGKLNAGLDHLWIIEIGEEPSNLEEGLLDAHLFVVHVANDNFADIIYFLTTRMTPEGYTNQKKK